MKTRRNIKMKRGGTVRFSNQTAANNAVAGAAPFSNEPAATQHLIDLYDRHIQIPPAPFHEENAHFLASVVATHDNPALMQQAVRQQYMPEPLNNKDYAMLIDLVNIAPVPEKQKERILRNLRYRRVQDRIRANYGNVPTVEFMPIRD